MKTKRERIFYAKRQYKIHKCMYAGSKEAERPCLYCTKIQNSQHAHRNHLCPPPSFDRKPGVFLCPGISRYLEPDEWILVYRHYQNPFENEMPIFRGVFKGTLTKEEEARIPATEARLQAFIDNPGLRRQKRPATKIKASNRRRGTKRKQSLVKKRPSIKKAKREHANRCKKNTVHSKKSAQTQYVPFESAVVGVEFDRLRQMRFSESELRGLNEKMRARGVRRKCGPKFVQTVHELIKGGREAEALVLLRWGDSYENSKPGNWGDWETKAFGKSLQEKNDDILICPQAQEVYGRIMKLIDAIEPKDEKYEVEGILSDRKGKQEFLVKWKGYVKPTWEPRESLSHLWIFQDYIHRKRRKKVQKMVKIEPGKPARSPIAFPHAMVGVEYAKLQCKPFNTKELNRSLAELESRVHRAKHGRNSRSVAIDEVSPLMLDRVDYFMGHNMEAEALVLLRWGNFWYKKIFEKGSSLAREKYGEAPWQIWHKEALGRSADDIQNGIHVLPMKIILSKFIKETIDLTNDQYEVKKELKIKVKEEPCESCG